MIRTGLAFVAAMIAFQPCAAQQVDSLLGSCGLAADQQTCDQTQTNFKADWQKAFAGDDVGQSNVASYLDAGWDGAVRVNRPLSCAWRMVLLSSGSTRITDNDALKFDRLCKLKLSDTEMGVARDQAASLFQRVYGRAQPGSF